MTEADDRYVPIERRFGSVSDDPSSGISRRFWNSAGKLWEEVVPATQAPSHDRSAVIILAPSGVGKTAELKARATSLQGAGVAAFFMRAIDVATSGAFGATLDAMALRTWVSTTERAVIFVDAVDEARLEGHDLEQVLRRLSQDLDPATKSLQLVLTSRNDVWTPTDARHVVRALALPADAISQANSPLRLFRLEPLSRDDVAIYARANGVRDVDAFVTAYLQEELDLLFELRPPDLRILVEYWKQHGAFGSWTEMLEATIEASVREENRRHAQQQQFTLEEARKGLARIGAATILSKKPIISLPGATHPGEVSAERLFADQRPAATSQLLTMGLFVQKGLHSVQLPQGAPSHFLAASWLSERAKSGWDQRAVEDALFIKPFGTELTLIPPSRSPVVGWVAGTVESVRRRLLKDLPHVLLFEGDPSKLSRGECVQALRAVLADIRAGRGDPGPTRGTLRQIAKHDIEDAVLRLLGEFAGAPRAERLLLRIAEMGGYSGAVESALRLALSPDGYDEVVGVAIRVVANSGTSQQRTQLLTLTTHASEWRRLALAQSLVPATLNGTTLVRLALAISRTDVAHLLAKALEAASLDDIDAILQGLQSALASSMPDDQTEASLQLASRLAVTRLERGGIAFPAWMAPLLLSIEPYLAGPFYIPTDALDSLERYLAANVFARRSVWSARIAAASTPNSLFLTPRLGGVSSEDLEWHWEQRVQATDTNLAKILELPVAESFRQLSPAERAVRMQAPDFSSELSSFIEQIEAAGVEARVHREHEAEKRAAEKARIRAKNVAEVGPNRADIEAGTNERALVWAWHQLRDTDGSRGRLGTGVLAELVGPELTESFLKGFRQWWRHYDPAIPQPGATSIPSASLAGLTGLSLAIEDGLDLATLSNAEVALAVRYALYELNALPIWFDALRATHAARVREVLAQVVHDEWAATVEHHGVISHAPYEPGGTAALIRNLVSDELDGGAPGHWRTISHAVAALLSGERGSPRTALALKRHVECVANGEVPTLAEWLRGWSHFAPAEAARWLQRLSSLDFAKFLDVVGRVAVLLEEDFDEARPPAVAIGWAPAALEAWVTVLHRAVPPEDDIARANGRAYTPGPRDRAQAFRNRCVAQLARDPSREAFDALKRIRASEEMKSYIADVDASILSQLTAAAEHLATGWTEKDILSVERGDERPPKTNLELFALLQRHLSRVADLLENDDFSYALLFAEGTDEREIQCWIASALKLVSRGLYTVEREPEVQDDKEMDISITVPGIGRVPVEIKPLYRSRYSNAALKDFVSHQLLGRYMRPAAVDRGIFLMVPLVTRTWVVGGRRVSFDKLKEQLSKHANKVAARAYKEIVIASIDVAAARASKQGMPNPPRSTRSRKQAPRKTSKKTSTQKRRTKHS